MTSPSLQRAVLHHQLGDHAAARLLLGFQARADGRAVGVGLVFVQLGRDQQRFEQVVDALAGRGAGFARLRRRRPIRSGRCRWWKAADRCVDVRAGQVDLVHGHDDRHIRGPGVADRFLGLRHDAVVGGDDEHGDVGDVGAAGPHFGERLVARRIDERNAAAVCVRSDRRGCAA